MPPTKETVRHEHFFAYPERQAEDDFDDVNGRYDAVETADGEFLVYSPKDDRYWPADPQTYEAACEWAKRLAAAYRRGMDGPGARRHGPSPFTEKSHGEQDHRHQDLHPEDE